MSTLTDINALPIPSLSDDPNIVTAVGPLAQAVDKRILAVFDTVTARDTAIPAPEFGMQAACKDTTESYWYNGTAWVGARPRNAIKTSNQPVGGTTLVNDTDLRIAVEAGSRYRLIGSVRWCSTGTEANDIRIGFTTPTASNGSYLFTAADGNLAAGSMHTQGVDVVDLPWNAQTNYGTLTGFFTRNWFQAFLITTTTAGDVQFMFGERVHIGSSTVTVAQYSWLECLKIG